MIGNVFWMKEVGCDICWSRFWASWECRGLLILCMLVLDGGVMIWVLEEKNWTMDFLRSFELSNDWSVFIEEVCWGIIVVCWGIGEKWGCFEVNVKFERLEVDRADTMEWAKLGYWVRWLHGVEFREYRVMIRGCVEFTGEGRRLMRQKQSLDQECDQILELEKKHVESNWMRSGKRGTGMGMNL